VTGRLLASLLASAFLAIGAGAGFGEPRPAPRLLPAEQLPLGAGLTKHPASMGPLRRVDALPAALPAVKATLPVSSVERDIPASAPARAASSGLADALKPVVEISESRSKP
jgi:hypothetical protein